MSAKKSPYTPNSVYDNLFTYIRKAGQKGVTKAQILEAGHPKAAMGVIISPQETSKHGDRRGNASAAGHIYFVKRNARKVKAGVKEVQRLSIGWRKVEMEPKKRTVKVVVEAEAKKITAKKITKATAKKITAKA